LFVGLISVPPYRWRYFYLSTAGFPQKLTLLLELDIIAVLVIRPPARAGKECVDFTERIEVAEVVGRHFIRLRRTKPYHGGILKRPEIEPAAARLDAIAVLGGNPFDRFEVRSGEIIFEKDMPLFGRLDVFAHARSFQDVGVMNQIVDDENEITLRSCATSTLDA
jgi:hypothetical protein